jgi:DNA polymerase (family 10)
MTDRQQVAEVLEEIAFLLDLLGENPFKSRAYENAARVLRAFDGDLDSAVRSGEIKRVKGIGVALADKIKTLVLTGELPYLDGLRLQVPQGLLDWLRIPGLGPKKARAIHVALGISTLAELEAACRGDRIRELPGFGDTSQRKILEGIGRLRQHVGRFLQPVVQKEARRLLEAVVSAPGVRRAEVAGSVRRRCETSKDIDIVAAAEDAGPVMTAFAAVAGVVEVTGKGTTKCSVRLAAGPAADLRVVSDTSYPFALTYFTGSKAHNIALRARAQRNGLKLNEYALVREEDGASIACEDETAIYRALNLDYIEPEIREDQGEIEAAEAGKLPRLVRLDDLKGILHVHSTWSDGLATIEEMAEAAMALDMSYLGLCDHSKAAAYARGLDEARFLDQFAEIDDWNARHGGRCSILKGVEVDILPDGRLDFDDDVLARFDLVVASIHSRFNLGAEEQTERLLRALDCPYVDMLGHLTGRLLLSRDPYALDVHRVLDKAAERGVAVEINAHPQRLDLDPPALRYGLARGLKTSINPDAHDTAGLGDIAYGVGIARKGWCTKDDVLNTMPVTRLREHIAARRRAAGAEGK